MIDLLSERAGGRVVAVNDEFFAPAENLIKVAAPIANDQYTDRGKWMDGWESRRRRDPGHDWCVLELGIPGRIESVTVDTSHFTGNYPEAFSLDASPGDEVWSEAMAMTPLEGDSIATFDIDFDRRVLFVRLNIYPDGGVARLRVEGSPIPDMRAVCPGGPADLASAIVGGTWLDASNYHYSPPSNLLLPTDSAGMWDGWETKRRRGPGFDWATFRLGLRGMVESVLVDTTHFKGNSPGWVSFDTSEDGDTWSTVVDHVAVAADSLNPIGLPEPVPASHVRLSLHPDGGVARMRVLGRPDAEAAGAVRLEYLNSLFDEAAAGFFHTACASSKWVEMMLNQRPYESVIAVLESTESGFDQLEADDWLEAFAGHPRIGESGDDRSSREQVGAIGHETELAAVNAEYQERFGFIFIVYASGKTGEEMIGIARERLLNAREEEIVNASVEQRQITRTRLLQMLCQEER